MTEQEQVNDGLLLVGLDGANPLAFLAALGTLRGLTIAWPERRSASLGPCWILGVPVCTWTGARRVKKRRWTGWSILLKCGQDIRRWRLAIIFPSPQESFVTMPSARRRPHLPAIKNGQGRTSLPPLAVTPLSLPTGGGRFRKRHCALSEPDRPNS